MDGERSRDARLATWDAVRMADGQPVLVMMPRAEHPTPADIERVRMAHDMLRRVSHPGVVEPLELLAGQQSAVLVMRRPAGAPVATLLGAGPLPLDNFLRFATDMAGALAAVHAAGIVHRAVSTDAFSLADGRSSVVLGDFRRATVMPRQTQGLVAPTALEGNLTYLSPEQTGRINRSIDFRTDLYSLGVVLYELLTGRPPFAGTEPLQLVHSHIARHPVPPIEHRPNVPRAISAIVLRLLAKNAEDRYASAAGLEADLRTCLNAVLAGRPVPDLEPGNGEVSSRFQIPEKLYGREAEVARLVSAFERVGEGRPALLLVAGYSGVGKSSLVREIHRPVVERRGYFADGKFDQYKRNVPFASLHSALRSLVRQILAEDATRIAAHRDRLLEAVGPNGQLLVDVVPEFGRLLGPQPAAPELPGREARNRFQRLLRDVVSAFCSPSHPLCLFLDDLQWVDSATLEWLESMLTDSRTGWLFLIGAYRDHEVGPAHPLALMFQRLRAQSLAVEEIALGPLDAATVERITADTLHADVAAVRPLAQLISAKTGGNAFFVNQLLESLHRTGAITFDSASGAGRWRWDPAQAAAAEVSENVVEFVTERLHRMDDDAQRVLHVAACLGNQFSPALLGMVSGDEPAALRAVLAALQVEGFLVEAGLGDGSDHDAERLRFVHDRVQQAAYGLRDEAETHAVRLRVGRHLLAATADAARDDALFDILQHFNVAAAEVTDRDEQLVLATLNLAAAARARAATAYGPAQAHVAAAEEFARRAGVDREGRLAFDLALEQAECAHLLGSEAEARAGYARALAAASDDFERSRVYEQKIHFHTNRAEFRDAFATGLEAAALFGIKLPRSFVPPLFLAEYGRARLRLRGRDIPGLVSHPELTDERRRTAMQFMGAVAKAGFQIRPELCVHICTRIVNESLTYGNTPETVIGYLAFGVIFSGSILGNADAGYRYGQLVLGLVDRYDPSPKRAEVNFVYGYFAHSWARPYATTERYFRAAYQAGLDTGDYFHAGLACAGVVHNLWMRGARLEDVEDEATRLEDFLLSVQGHEPLGALQSIRAAVRALRSPGADGPALSAEGFDEAALVASLPGFGSPHVAHIHHVTKLQAMVLRRDAAGALAAAAESRRYRKGSAGLQQVAEHDFWSAFAHSLAGSPRAARVLRAASRRFAKWARDCAENFESRRLLLAGEAARLDGRSHEALLLFERAMETAHRAGQLQYEAMAGERAGETALAAGRPRAARAYLGAAADGWRRWGAESLAAALESRHPAVLERSADADAGAGAGSQLDLQTVVKSTQAISQAVQLPVLLATLLETVRENAGAERAVVFLIDETGCTVQADGRVGEPTRTLQRIPLDAYDGAPRSMVNYVVHSSESIVIGDASRDAEWATDQYVRRVRPRSVLCAPIVRQGTLAGVIYLENNAMPGAFTPERLELISVLSAQIAISLDNAYLVERLEERVQARTQQLEARNQFIRRTFGRFLSDDVVDSLLDTSAGSHLGGEKRKVTIMMADLRGFSAMAEALPPETVMAVINNYLGAMTEVIMAHQGTIDEFIGDAILAIFGAPVQRDDDAERAVACALAMQQAMEEVNARNRSDGLPEVAMGIGLNTGEVVVGSIGSEKRAKYGVVGAAVNLASRIEGHTLPGQILVSARTRDEVASPLRIGGELRVQPKGSREPMSLYDVVGIEGSWNLSLARDAVITRPLARSIDVEYGALSGKSIGAEQHRGAIVALDEGITTCELQGALPLFALDNVWLTIAGAAGVTGEERAFGKVTASDGAGRCTVRFTSAGESTLRRLREGVASAGASAASD